MARVAHVTCMLPHFCAAWVDSPPNTAKSKNKEFCILHSLHLYKNGKRIMELAQKVEEARIPSLEEERVALSTGLDLKDLANVVLNFAIW